MKVLNVSLLVLAISVSGFGCASSVAPGAPAAGKVDLTSSNGTPIVYETPASPKPGSSSAPVGQLVVEPDPSGSVAAIVDTISQKLSSIEGDWIINPGSYVCGGKAIPSTGFFTGKSRVLFTDHNFSLVLDDGIEIETHAFSVKYQSNPSMIIATQALIGPFCFKADGSGKCSVNVSFNNSASTNSSTNSITSSSSTYSIGYQVSGSGATLTLNISQDPICAQYSQSSNTNSVVTLTLDTALDSDIQSLFN